MRLLCLLFSFILLSACSNRQAIQFNKTKSDDYWYCQSGANKEWKCSDAPANFKPKAASRSAISSNDSTNQPQFKKALASFQKDLEPLEVQQQTTPEVPQPIEKEEVGREPKKVIEPAIINPAEQAIVSSMTVNNPWLVQLAAFTNRTKAQQYLETINFDMLGKQEIISTNVEQKTWYQVVLRGFADKASAQQAATEVVKQHPKIKPWVRKSR